MGTWDFNPSIVAHLLQQVLDGEAPLLLFLVGILLEGRKCRVEVPE